MADDRVSEAVDVVARQVMYALVDREGEEWENYPDIGEDDWLRVQKRAFEIADAVRPSPDQYIAAYDFLSERATSVD